MTRPRSNTEVAETLKYWRSQKGFSQMKLADLANTSALTISQLESGKRKARGKTLNKILDGFGLTEDEFFARRDRASIALEAPAMVKPVEAPRPAPVVTAPIKDPGVGTRLSNLDLELLNRILNLDFDAKLETLRFLQNLR